MTPEQFVYWLQGFKEIGGYKDTITAKEWQIIKDHLEQVFIKRTPIYDKDTPFPDYDRSFPVKDGMPLPTGTPFIC